MHPTDTGVRAFQSRSHRTIAKNLGRPVSTVRDWLRDFRANAPAIAADFTARVHQATAESLGFWPAAGPTIQADALAMLMAYAQVLAHHHRPKHSKPFEMSEPSQCSERYGPAPVIMVTWHQAALFAVGPWLFSRIGWPELLQHESALPPEG